MTIDLTGMTHGPFESVADLIEASRTSGSDFFANENYMFWGRRHSVESGRLLIDSVRRLAQKRLYRLVAFDDSGVPLGIVGEFERLAEARAAARRIDSQLS